MTTQALLVGINHYPDPRNNLSGCLTDVRALRHALMRHGVPSEQIQLLVDHDAKEAVIKGALTRMSAAAQAGDTIIFGESSHGARIPDDSEPDGYGGALVTYDFDWGATSWGIRDHWLRQWMATLKPGVRCLIWLDTCFAGEMDRTWRRDPAERPRFLEPPLELAVRQLFLDKPFGLPRETDDPIAADVALVAACRPDQTSSEARVGWLSVGGAFTQRALAVDERADHGTEVLTWQGLIDKTAEQLKADGFAQVPELFALGPRAGELAGMTIPKMIGGQS